MADIGAMLAKFLPAIKTFGIIFLGGSIAVGLAYYFLIVKRRKKWLISVYELKSDGRLHMIGKDELLEKRYNHGRTIMYWLSKLKQETTPPPAEAVDRVMGKDYADYLRIRHAVIPLTKATESTTRAEMMRLVGENMDGVGYKALEAMRNNPKFQTKPIFGDAHAIESRFIFVPINKVPHVDIAYNQMDYDVDMLRINQIDNIDQMFSAQKTFWEKYGLYMLIGFMVVAVIVIAYLAFDFMNGVISQNLAQTNAVVQAIKNINIGGGATPPP